MSLLSGSELPNSLWTSASSLIGLQILSRMFTSMLNQALFRLASPSAFGAAAIQFELLLSTILFLSREGVRNALLRVELREDDDTNIRRLNLSFLPIVLGIPLSLLTSVLYIYLAGQEIKQQPHFQAAITLYALAAMTELLSEPMYNLAMTRLKMSVRLRAEGLGITLKSITTFLILLYDSKRDQGTLALVAFAVGQLLYGLAMAAAYIYYLGPTVMFPRILIASNKSIFDNLDPTALKLSTNMTIQSIFKHFLTEGDKLIISWFSPLHDQGGYAIATNYGSLIARVMFHPIEETLRLFFSRILGTKSKSQASTQQAVDTLHALLAIQMAFSMILLVFGSAYLPILLPLLLPQQYLSTSAPSVLAAWVWYIPVLAVNGGLEAFHSSVATPKDLNTQSRWMIAFSTIFVLSAIFLYHLDLGDASLVYANTINLCARITYCLVFSSNYFNTSSSINFRWYNCLPPLRLWLVSGASAILIYTSEYHFEANEVASRLGRKAVVNSSVQCHVAIGVSLASMCLGTWWITSGHYINIAWRRKLA